MSGATSAIAIGSLAVSAIGAGVGAVGAISSANAASASANYNAQVAQQNQQIATQNATLAGQAGEAQAAQQQQKTRAEVGAIKTSQAAGNIDVNSGSALDVQSSAASLGELNAITIRGNAAKEAYGYETQSTSFENQAQLDAAQSSSDMTAGEIGAGSTILGGLGSAGSSYAKYMTQSSGGLTAPDYVGNSGLGGLY
jgi:hypothetical protein